MKVEVGMIFKWTTDKFSEVTMKCITMNYNCGTTNVDRKVRTFAPKTRISYRLQFSKYLDVPFIFGHRIPTALMLQRYA